MDQLKEKIALSIKNDIEILEIENKIIHLNLCLRKKLNNRLGLDIEIQELKNEYEALKGGD